MHSHDATRVHAAPHQQLMRAAVRASKHQPASVDDIRQ
jgi:hypothetical protein